MTHPSRIHDRFWLQAWAPNRKVTSRVGKWILRVPAADVDSAWRKVHAALQAGRLGPSAKVRTAVPHPLYADDVKVICVYTRDANDEVDKGRVRRELAKLGFVGPWTYRTDAETLAGMDCLSP